MPQERIPFVNQQATGLDELAGGGREAMNVIIDPLGSVRRRPGIAEWCSAEPLAGLDTIYATVNGAVFALSKTPPVRQLFHLTTGGISEVPGIDLVGMRRPVVAETESCLVFAAGSTMTKMTFQPEETTNLGGGPPEASHVIAQSSRLLCNDVTVDKTKVHYSGQALGTSFAGFEQWSTLVGGGFFTAEARPDPVVALAETTNEVFVFGTTTVQIYAPDALFVFSSVATREYGLGAPYSLVKVEQAFAYLDHRRRIVLGDGRSVEVISGPIQRALDEMTVTDDCYGFRVNIGPTDALCYTFPTDGRTFVYQKGSGWGQWTGWEDTTNGYKPFGCIAAAHNPVTNETLAVMLGGRVGVFQTGVNTDMGERIQASVTTGYQSHQTDSLKHCAKVRFALRRGEVLSSEGPQAWFTYRDRPGAFEDLIPIDLGASADTDVVVEFRSLGTYRRRQWRFEFSGTEDLVLTSATEDYETLED